VVDFFDLSGNSFAEVSNMHGALAFLLYENRNLRQLAKLDLSAFDGDVLCQEFQTHALGNLVTKLPLKTIVAGKDRKELSADTLLHQAHADFSSNELGGSTEVLIAMCYFLKFQ